MVDFESRLRTQLKKELDAVEPSAVAWPVIVNGRRKPFRRPVPRRLALAVATAGVAAAILAGFIGLVPRETSDVGVVAPPGTRTKPGVVIDEVGDAAAPHLDLTKTTLRVVGDDMTVTWEIAGPIPKEADRVDFRVAFFGMASSATVVNAKIDGDERNAGVVQCPAVTDGPPDCTGRRYQISSAKPVVDGKTVTLTIPVRELGVDVTSARWTAYIQEVA